MEDEHIVRLNVQKNPISHLFAVFDGHGGKSVSEYAADNLAEVLTRLPAYGKLIVMFWPVSMSIKLVTRVRFLSY